MESSPWYILIVNRESVLKNSLKGYAPGQGQFKGQRYGAPVTKRFRIIDPETRLSTAARSNSPKMLLNNRGVVLWSMVLIVSTGQGQVT